MSKKWIVALSIIFAVIAVLLILFWTLFGLSAISVEFDSTTQNLTVTQEEIVEAGGFRKGASVLFEGKQKSIQKIYDKASENENFAYIKVLNIETVFPNKFVIHITEREELFAVEYNGQVLICDRDLRVLRSVSNFNSTQSNAILVKGLQVLNENVKVGDFLSVKQENVKKLYSAFLKNNKNYAQQVGKFKEMQFGEYEDSITKKEYVSLKLTTFNNRKFLINNIDFAIPQKIQLMFAVESSLYGQEFDQYGNVLKNGSVFYVFKTQDGEYLPYDENEEVEEGQTVVIEPLNLKILSGCMIKVDNMTLSPYVNRTEKDIYYSLMEE